MPKTTFTGYVPSLKAKHKATITEGKAIESKGGSIRYTIQGLYDGRKTFPKTVTKADFEGVYGFDAKEAESVVIYGKTNDKREVIGHVVGETDKDGFTPSSITPESYNILTGSRGGLKHILDNHADTVGSPSPTSVEPPAPSEKPFPQEPTNADFSATTERVIITLGDDPEDDEDEEEIEEEIEETDDEDEQQEDSTTDENEEEDDSDEEKEEKVEDEDEEQEEDDSEEEDEDEEEFEAISVEVEREKKEDKDEDEDEDGLLTPTNVALGLGAVALGVAVFGAEGDNRGDWPKESKKEFTKKERDEYDEHRIGPVVRDNYDKNRWTWCNKDSGLHGHVGDTTKGHTYCSVCGNSFNAETVGSPSPTFNEGITGQDGPSAEPTNADFSAEGVCGCGINCVCDCGCAESGVCNCGESCPCDCGCGVESFGTDSLVEEPDWIPDGDGRALGQQNLDINLSPLHAEQNEYHTSNVFYADEEEYAYEPTDEEMAKIWEREQKIREMEPTELLEDDDYTTLEGTLDAEGEDVQKMTSSEFVPFDQITSEIQQEWDETTAPIAADYEPSNEPTNANFSADSRMEKRLKEEFARNPRCRECGGGTTEEIESGVQGTYVYQCQNEDCLWNSWPPHREESRSIGEDESLSAEVDKEFYENVSGSLCPNCGRDGDLGHFSTLYWCDDCGNEGCDGCTNDCDCETKEAESKGLSKNAQYAIGLAALGVGIALWNGDWVSKMFDRFKR